MTSSPPRKLLVSVMLPAALAIALGACSRKPAEPSPEPAATPATSDTRETPIEAVSTDNVPEEAIVTPLPPGAEQPPADVEHGFAGKCNGGAVQSLVGQEATDAVLEQAKSSSGASAVRALKPGQPATMDFRPDRLSIALDEKGIIQALHCG